MGELGPVVVSLAEAGARLGLLVAYSTHFLAHAHSLGADSRLASETEVAQLDAPSKVPTGMKVQIGELDDLDDGMLVEDQGRIENLSLDHDPKPPKFSTFVVLRAFDADASIRLRAHMFSLAKNGLVDGAGCKVRGFIRRKQPWLGEDEVGLDIDRVSLSKLRKTSWLDAVTYWMRPFFRLYPHCIVDGPPSPATDGLDGSPTVFVGRPRTLLHGLEVDFASQAVNPPEGRLASVDGLEEDGAVGADVDRRFDAAPADVVGVPVQGPSNELQTAEHVGGRSLVVVLKPISRDTSGPSVVKAQRAEGVDQAELE
ncbi:hypothetical protein [Enhygromyxa salina]|uniref:Uncharacterized protein n=1 Tax=Enhygromyxa salina TaxID=215803 RepID=A0A2S9XTA5_9BACT|nr:hypothetical protein [Enhygromyxa salina]PRP96092.1 hypothetical protein ENSA7_69060 [Enhygromyxa salina]